MALLTIPQYRDERLHVRARRARRGQGPGARSGGNNVAAPGVGLSATQVDVYKQVIAVDVSEDQSDLKVLINPVIAHAEGVAEIEEGCLSLPGIFERISRAQRITVHALDLEGAAFEICAEGLLAVCIQHEIDHLEGKVFVEQLSRLKQQRVLARLNKRQRRAAV